MLLSLAIRDFVIVDQLTLSFSSGFTVLTGETGAGKSILIDALGLLLGARAEADMVRKGREKADLSAELAMTPTLQAWLDAESLGNDPEGVIVRRVIESTGRSKAYINGTIVPLSQLKILGEFLIDIHGQHAHHALLREEAQRQLLDAYANHMPLVGRVREAYRDWQQKRQLREAAEKAQADHQEQRERLLWQINEVAPVAISAEDWGNLTQEHHRLHHADSLIDGVQKALALLAEDEHSCQSLLSGALSQLQHLEDQQGLAETTNGLTSCEAELNEAIYALQRYADRLESDPARLSELETQMSQIWSMARKYRVEPEELSTKLTDWQAQLDALDAVSDPIKLLQEEETAAAQYLVEAETLSASRLASAKTLGEKVTTFMQTMAMPDGQFAIALLPSQTPHAYGLETIEYQVAPHAGASLKSLAKVASGGELSRIGLALQVATSEVAAVPTLIFDEVDVGIGGRVAEIVGQLLKRLGKQYQVLCITHLPQVAACGDQQLQVSKQTVDGNVISHVETLDDTGRIEEIARMLGGVEITETTRQHAMEMLSHDA